MRETWNTQEVKDHEVLVDDTLVKHVHLTRTDAEQAVTSSDARSHRGVHAPDVGPAGPASLLEELEQAVRTREGLDERRVQQRDQVVAHGVFVLDPHGLGCRRLDEGCDTVC
jgi:hypothetical protein